MLAIKNVGDVMTKRVSDLRVGDTFIYEGSPFLVILRNGHKVYVNLERGFGNDNLGSDFEAVQMIECELKYWGATKK